jgi:hypothetical protein
MTEENYKIIKIIDDYKVVINAGKIDDVKKGNEFEIYIEGVELKDEKTGESYGKLDYVKATIKAIEVFEKVSICKNVETHTEQINVPSMHTTMAKINEAFSGTTVTTTKPLNVDESEITGYGFEIDDTIKIGDLVRKKDETFS